MAILGALAWLAAGAALAQSAAQPGTVSASICADRPGKGTATCTAPADHWQVEVDAADLTQDRSSGNTSDLGIFAAANIKYGVSDRFDLELAVPPWESSRMSGGPTTSGFGDAVARAKLALTAQDSPVTAALDPYLKLPTAQHSLGNGAYEGGIVAPVSMSLPFQTSLGLSPEIDWLQNADGHGRHVNFAGALGLGVPLGSGLTGGLELWGALNEDPGGWTRQASGDLSLAWIPTAMPALQLDGGLNFGLNRATPDIQAYVGMSRRF
jgi:hypothetical protein